jgi:tRNA(Leu) C34 or U34 (ribose-2'-O)-methylase TrmL
MTTRHARARDIEALTLTYSHRGWSVQTESCASRPRASRIRIPAVPAVRAIVVSASVALIHLAALKWLLLQG